MPVFRFTLISKAPVQGYIEIEAPNEDIAWEKAQNDSLISVDWELTGEPDFMDVDFLECEKVEDD